MANQILPELPIEGKIVPLRGVLAELTEARRQLAQLRALCNNEPDDEDIAKIVDDLIAVAQLAMGSAAMLIKLYPGLDFDAECGAGA